MNVVTTAPSVLQTIRKAAAASPDREICGLLQGSETEIVVALVSPNRHPEPDKGFAICDAFHAKTQRDARARGLRTIGCFHSHPSGSVEPSQTDLLAVHEDGFIWIICAPDGGLAAWRANVKSGVKSFSSLELNIRAETGVAPEGGAV